MSTLSNGSLLESLRDRLGSSRRREDLLLREIGRAALSSPRFDSSFDGIAEAVARLLPNDRLSIRFVDLDANWLSDAYSSGVEIPGHEPGATFPLEGTITEEAVRGRTVVRVGDELPETIVGRYPGAKTSVDTGLRSSIVVPMTTRGKIVPALVLVSMTPSAYSEEDENLSREVAAILAAPLANALANSDALISLSERLGSSTRRADELEAEAETRMRDLEDLRDRLAETSDTATQAGVMAEIGGIAGGAQDLADAYDALAEGISSALGFVVMDIVALDTQSGRGRVVYSSDPGNVEPDDGFEIEGSVYAGLLESDATVIGGTGPTDGMRSSLVTPMRAGGRIVGALVLRTDAEDAYSETDALVAEQIAARVEGAFASSLERALLREEIEQRAAIAEVGRVAGLTSDLSDSFAAIAGLARRVLPHDLLSVEELAPDTSAVEFAAGTGAPDIGTVFSLDAAVSEAVSNTVGLAVSSQTTQELGARFPERGYISVGGFTSLLAVPLVARDRPTGLLLFHSTEPARYDNADTELAAAVAAQLVSALESSRLARTMEEQVALAAERASLFDEIRSAIGTAQSPDEAYRRLSELLKGMIAFDRIGIGTVDLEDGTVTYRYCEGTDEAAYRIGLPGGIVGTIAQEAATRRGPVVVQGEPPQSMSARYPGLVTGLNKGLRSFLDVPVKVGGRVVGIVGLGSRQPSAFSNIDILDVERVASYLSGLIEAARIEDAHELDTREQQVFAEMSRTLGSVMDIRLGYDRIAEYLGRLVPYDRIAVWTVDVNSGDLVAAYPADAGGAGEDPDDAPLLGTGQPPQTSTAGGQSIPDEMARFLKSSDGEMPSLLVMPLVFAGDTVGMISLRSAKPNAYTGKDAATVERFAAQIAGPVSNSQIYTESKRVEEAVHEVIQRLDLAIQGTGDGLWDWKLTTGEMWWSPRYKELVGYQEADGDGGAAGWEARLHPEDRDRVLGVLKAHIEGKAPYRVEYRLRTGEGRYTWFSDRAEALRDDDGSVVRMAGSLRPITDATAVGATPAGGHDVITPLIAVEVFKAALLKDRPSASASGESGYLNAVASAGRPLKALLEGLDELNLAREAEVNKVDVDLSAMARSVVAGIRKIEPGSRTVTVAKNLRVEADEALLRVVLEKLLENAWKFTSTRKRSRISVGSEERDGSTAYFVRDNGDGFVTTDDLFRPFHRAHSPAEFGGVGLGLATAREAITRQGGRVWAESEPGKGATFFFTL